jgi:capsular polysaccharide transport system permease protein
VADGSKSGPQPAAPAAPPEAKPAAARDAAIRARARVAREAAPAGGLPESISLPPWAAGTVREDTGRGASKWMRLRLAAFALIVLIPTLGGAVFAFGIAADLYVSETRFWVRGQKNQTAGLLGGLLGQIGLSASPEEALSVKDYVHSHDAVAGLLERIDLRAIYRRPEADVLNRLEADPSMERLVEYHRGMVEARYDTTSGITTMRVFAWRPEDAKLIADALLEQSEALVNRFSERAIEDSLRLAREEVSAAEQRVAEVRVALTAFRDRARELDPGQAGAAVLALVAGLEGQLAQVRAEIAEHAAFMRSDHPRLVSLRARASAIEEQIAHERARLTGTGGALAPVIAEYEQLQLAREFADRALASALTSLEQARIEAQRQQLYLVRVVEPQLPDEALYPRRWLILLGAAVGSLLVYGIGTLVVAGVRDHIT